MKLILQPCGNEIAMENYKKTIIHSNFDVESIKDFINEENVKTLKEICKNEKLKIWGVKKVHAQKWDKVSKDDYAIFSRNSNIFASFRVIYKIHSVQLANFLWGKDDHNQTWEYIYFLTDFKDLQIPVKDFNNLVGFKENNIIRSFNILDAEKANAFISKYII